MPERSRIRTAFGTTALLSALALFFLWAWLSPEWVQFSGEDVASWVETLGIFGPPFAIVAMMCIAVVASPIPSAPIALAAGGAAFGQVAGTLYVAVGGAELGALFAFLISRLLGRQAVERILGPGVDAGLLGSQNALTLVVFTSRLLPFVSFDVMSYAAGLSRLHLWRFLLATLAGILPASFVLAYLGGSEAMSGQLDASAWVAIGLGLMTAAPPILVVALRHKPGAVSKTHKSKATK